MGDHPIGGARLERAGIPNLGRIGGVFPGELRFIHLINGLRLCAKAAESLAQRLFDHLAEEIGETCRTIAPMLMRARLIGGRRPVESDAHQIIADRLGEEVVERGVVRRAGGRMRNVE